MYLCYSEIEKQMEDCLWNISVFMNLPWEELF